MRMLLAAALLAAGPAAAQVVVTGPADAPTITLTSRSHVLTGEIASPRGRRERLILDLTTVTRETLGEKGIAGEAEIRARPAGRDTAALYTLRLPGRTATLDEAGLVAVDLDDCCVLHRAYHDAATGERLFETTVPTAALTIEGPSWKWRRAAFVAAMDDRADHRAWGENAVGLVAYAAADRTIRSVLVEAADAGAARRLRSLWDERTALAWVDRRTDAPIVTVPEQGPTQPALRLHFVTSGIEVFIPLREDDLVPDVAPAGLRLTPQRALPLAGGWRVATAAPAPWTQETAPQPLTGRYILFAPRRVRSAGSVLDCDNAAYEEASVPHDGLFLGAGLSRDQATSLGLDPIQSPSVTLSCDTGVFAFHRTRDGRWLLGLDNVVYALERAVE